MLEDDFEDFFDEDELYDVDLLSRREFSQRVRKGQARQLYDRMMEQKRLKQLLDDELAF